MTSYELDGSARRIGGGLVLVGGSPLKLFRFSATGAAVVDSIERGDAVPPSPAASALVDRLVDAGAVHPRPAAGGNPGDVTVVIPARDVEPATLHRLVAECVPAGRVIVVDDASAVPIAPIVGATVIHRAVNGGPAAARTTGLDQVHTPLVAFVDTDVHLPPHWLEPLLGYFTDDRVALVAPRVASTPGASALARYEMLHSPLDLGSARGRVRAGTRVSYVPSAVVVCRVADLRAIGGFNVSLRVGEDVDLAWRLDESGRQVRFEPECVTHHQPRPTLGKWVRQRYDYGSSAAPLAQRHPGKLAPLRVSGWSAASWTIAACGWPIVGAGIAAATTALLARKLRDVPGGPAEALRLAGLGHLYAGRSVASAVTRAWWPVAVVAALVSKRCRRAVMLAALAPASIDWLRRRPGIDPVRYIGLRLLDDVSYGCGVIVGSARARSVDALTPDLTSWPKSKV